MDTRNRVTSPIQRTRTSCCAAVSTTPAEPSVSSAARASSKRPGGSQKPTIRSFAKVSQSVQTQNKTRLAGFSVFQLTKVFQLKLFLY